MEHPKTKPMQLRIPEDLKRWIKHRAIDNHRSANGEITAILKDIRQKENAPSAGTGEALDAQ